MKKAGEKVLLYQFTDEVRKESIIQLLQSMGIECKVLQPQDWQEKIGYLLGNPGFTKSKAGEEKFSFPYEVMIMQNIRNKRLDALLGAFRTQNLAPVIYKAVVTPFNTFWTLKKLCVTLQREHSAMVKAHKEDRIHE